MTLGDALAITAAGFAAGGVNTIVGSGSLVTFPILVAVGFSPVSSIISNAMGLVAGGFSGAWGYRREAASARRVGSAAASAGTAHPARGGPRRVGDRPTD